MECCWNEMCVIAYHQTIRGPSCCIAERSNGQGHTLAQLYLCFPMISTCIQNLSKYVSWLNLVLSEMFCKCCWLRKSNRDVKVRDVRVLHDICYRGCCAVERDTGGRCSDKWHILLLSSSCPAPAPHIPADNSCVWCRAGKLGVMAMNSFHFLP